MQPGPRVLKALAGEALDLNCVAEGTPEPRLTWAKDGVALRGEWPEGSVHFAAIRTSDAGTYRCEASSRAGVDAWELELRVLGESLNPRACLSPPPSSSLGFRDACLPSGLGACQTPLPDPWPPGPEVWGPSSPLRYSVLWRDRKYCGVVIEEQGVGPSPASSTYQLDSHRLVVDTL